MNWRYTTGRGSNEGHRNDTGKLTEIHGYRGWISSRVFRRDGTAPSGTSSFCARLWKEADAKVIPLPIVKIEQNDASRVEDTHQQNRQMFPELTACPYAVGKEPMIGIVCVYTLWVGQRKHAGYSLSGRAKDPAGHKIEKNACRGSCENGKKVLNYIRPCRSNIYAIHTSLPFQCFPISSSEGYYVYDNSASKLAA